MWFLTLFTSSLIYLPTYQINSQNLCLKTEKKREKKFTCCCKIELTLSLPLNGTEPLPPAILNPKPPLSRNSTVLMVCKYNKENKGYEESIISYHPSIVVQLLLPRWERWLAASLSQTQHFFQSCLDRSSWVERSRPPDKSVWSKINFLISQLKHMLWVLKRTVSMRRFFLSTQNKRLNWRIRKC